MTKQTESLQLFLDPFMPSNEEAKKRNNILRDPEKLAKLEKQVTLKVNMIPFG